MSCGTRRNGGTTTGTRPKAWWKPAAECDRTALLCLRRPTRVSALRDSVPRPRQWPVTDALPLWQARQLYEKTPMFHGHGPAGPIVLHRGPLSSAPLKATGSGATPDFSLADPHRREVSYDYNALHDPHASGWASVPGNVRLLRRQGLITDDLNVVCTLREYNEYRRFMWRQQNAQVARLLRERAEQAADRKLVFHANLEHEKTVEKTLKRLRFAESKKRPSMRISKNAIKLKQKCEISKTSSKKPTLKVKKIKTYTEFGLNKKGVMDQTKYNGTFIEGSQDDFYLLGFFKHFFKQNK